MPPTEFWVALTALISTVTLILGESNRRALNGRLQEKLKLAREAGRSEALAESVGRLDDQEERISMIEDRLSSIEATGDSILDFLTKNSSFKAD